MEKIYSYHIFYFPFKWSLPNEENKLFSEQVDWSHIPVEPFSPWERVQLSKDDECIHLDKEQKQDREELFNEQQYYFEFVHPVLYDMEGNTSQIIAHYERREPKKSEVYYHIKRTDKEYILRVKSINLNIYSTGIGMLTFFLENRRSNQREPIDIRNINQYGRRIMPPYYGALKSRNVIANCITIRGLQRDDNRYCDDFAKYKLTDSWKPANFVTNLITDFSSALKVVPVIDDRMFVNCWYGNNQLIDTFKGKDEEKVQEFVMGDFWYKYVFVDEGTDDTCQNDKMKKELLKESTYYRWQKYGSLFGVSRYSLVLLADEKSFEFLGTHMRTIYSRMLELVLVQRASMLKFSEEVTKVSSLSGKSNRLIAERIGSLYKEYIRFINQIYFRDITAQDQGIELYKMLTKQFNSDAQIKDLDSEIEELHQYITLLIDQKRSENGELLNILAAIFLPATILTGLFGMNAFHGEFNGWDFALQLILIIIASGVTYFILKKRRI